MHQEETRKKLLAILDELIKEKGEQGRINWTALESELRKRKLSDEEIEWARVALK